MVTKDPSLLKAKTNNNETPLHIAIANNMKEAAEFFLLHSSRKQLQQEDQNGETPYQMAISKDEKDVAEMIQNKIHSPVSSFFKSIPKATKLMFQ